MLTRYLSIALACASLLLGVQAPNFVDQYQKRVDAQWTEASTNVKAFQVIADQLHGGSMQALLQKHEASTDATFRQEAQAVRSLWERAEMLKREHTAMQRGLLAKVWHIAKGGNAEIRRATWAQYSIGLLLNSTALWCGLWAVLLALGLFEVSAWGLRSALSAKARREAEADDH
jgi:Protein of unknown function (DUF2937)